MSSVERGVSVDDVRRILDYDPETGVLRWKVRDDVPPQWSSQFAGKVAGTKTAGGVQIAITLSGVCRLFRANRIIRAIYYGEWPSRLVDHEDRNPFNNRISNLRNASKSQNNCNSPREDGRVRYKGVYLFKGGPKFGAQIKYGRKHHWLGLHDSAVNAALAYDREAIRLHGPFAVTNIDLFETIGERAIWAVLAAQAGFSYA